MKRSKPSEKKTEPLVKQIKNEAYKPVKKKPPVEFISTGSIILNLAASQKGKDGGWPRGRISNIVGDSSSGKTLLALEAAAWSFYNIAEYPSRIFPSVEKAIIVYDNIEGVMDFPVEEMYGASFVKGVDWIHSKTCEKFGREYQGRISKLKKGEFLLYIVDSIDALMPDAAMERIDAAIKKGDEEEAEKEKKAAFAEKARYFSQEFFGGLCSMMEGKDATLLPISQVREKIGVTFGKKQYRTGGKALDFYSHIGAWLSEIEKLKRIFRTQEKVFGIRSRARFEKNKVAKPFREGEVTILFDYGLDDIGSMLDYLYGPKNKVISWKELKKLHLTDYINNLPEDEHEAISFKKSSKEEEPYALDKKDLPCLIENSSEAYEALVDMVEKDWHEIEEEIAPKRKKRF